MSEPTTVTVLVPGASASSSKMSKKGWKCWAKWLSSVDSPAKDGYAYHGEFASVGSRVECELGDVLLHVDQSSNSGIGVVMTNSAGKAFFRWVDATSDAKWAGSLAKAARRLLKMTRQERIAAEAAAIAAETDEERIARGAKPLGDVAREYYRKLAGQQSETAAEQASGTTKKIEQDNPLNLWLANTRVDVLGACISRIEGLLDGDLTAEDKLANIRWAIDGLRQRQAASSSEDTYEGAVDALTRE